MTRRIAFVTIGQTPRFDLVPEMCALIGAGVDAEERGALDGLSHEAVAAMRPGTGDHRLVTRLADGSEAVIRKDLIYERLQRIFDDLTPSHFLCVVLLCTGQFPPFRTSALLLDAQSLVDGAVSAIAQHAQTIGLMLPLAEQIDEFHFRPRPDQRLQAAYASPYTPGRLEQAARELGEADLVVMHCMGYTEAMRQTVMRVTGRPVLLARRIVASAVAQLL